MKPATNPVDAWREATHHESVGRIEERGRHLFDKSCAIAGAGDYRACVYLDTDGNPTRRFQVGKPVSGGGDATHKGGGPYAIDMDNRTCDCPSKQGVTKEVDGKTVVIKEGEVSCKHIIGLFYQFAEWEYELKPIKNDPTRKLIVWTKRKDKKEEENDK